MTNLSLLFHKLYYEQLGNDRKEANEKTVFENAVERCNEKLFSADFIHGRDFQACEIPGVSCLRMKTKYPGLLIGTGYPHGSGQADDDIKCGFSFDFVSGQPYIPGSSVKGVLRSYFSEQPKAVAEIAGISEKNVKDLETDIFDGGDTFLDAVLYDGDRGNHVIGADYITPHSENTKNPIPIHIIKVLPDVRFEFRFIVRDFEKDGFVFGKERKTELFQTLLTLFGIGAKTNVGYGMLEPDDSIPSERRTAVRTSNPVQNASRRPVQNAGRPAQSAERTQESAPEKVKCPNCGYFNFNYSRQGRKNTYCKKCNGRLS